MDLRDKMGGFELMFDEFIATPAQITADEEQMDWYEAQRQYCEDCGGATYFDTDAECFYCKKEVN